MVFSVADKAVDSDSQPIGFVIICSALISDGLLGNVQQKMFKRYSCSVNARVSKTKLVSAFWALLISIFSGQLFVGVRCAVDAPIVVAWIVMYSIVGYSGENFVLGMLKRFGALTTVMTTSFRKLMTILLSFVLFPKPFVAGHALGIFLVFGGIAASVYAKNEASLRPKFVRWGILRRRKDDAKKFTSVV